MPEPLYTEAERAVLTAVLDAIVPPGAGGLPGAGEAGLAEALEREVPELGPWVKQAVAGLDAIAGDAGFAALDADARSEALRRYAEREPGFLPGVLFQTYTRYYALPRVMEAIGLEPRPPFPNGYTMAPSDLDALLAPVRSGPKRYREA